MIFNIGLPKTGTTTINKALNILGFKSIHDPFTETIELSKGNIGKIKALADKYNSFSGGCSICYKQLDVLFPGSIFILSTRDFDSWLNSCERWFNKDTKAPIRTSIFYGHSKFDKEAFTKAYNTYHAEVKEYFKHRHLFIIDIEKDNNWQILCSFLDKEIPGEDYPHENINKKR